MFVPQKQADQTSGKIQHRMQLLHQVGRNARQCHSTTVRLAIKVYLGIFMISNSSLQYKFVEWVRFKPRIKRNKGFTNSHGQNLSSCKAKYISSNLNSNQPMQQISNIILS